MIYETDIILSFSSWQWKLIEVFLSLFTVNYFCHSKKSVNIILVKLPRERPHDHYFKGIFVRSTPLFNEDIDRFFIKGQKWFTQTQRPLLSIFNFTDQNEKLCQSQGSFWLQSQIKSEDWTGEEMWKELHTKWKLKIKDWGSIW